MKGIFGDWTSTLADALMPAVILDSSESSKLNERVTSFENWPLDVTIAVEPALLIVYESSWVLLRPFGAETAFKSKLRSLTTHPPPRPHGRVHVVSALP